MTKTSIALTVSCLIAMTTLLVVNQQLNKEPSDYPFDGPDKAHAQNYLMTHDPSLNRIPYERLKSAHAYAQHLRTTEQRDFQWQNWNTAIPGRSRMLFLHPENGVLYSGSVSGALWKNTDFKNNASWEEVAGFSGSAVNCMASDPNNSNIVYLGTGESFTAFVNYRESTALGTGVYKSADGGNTWTLISSTQNFYFVNDIVVRNENGISVLYVAAGSGKYQGSEFKSEGLYRTENNGATWQQVLPTVPGSTDTYTVADLELSTSNRLYAGTMRNAQNKGGGTVLYTDDGITWNQYTGFADQVPQGWSAGRTIIKVSPSNPAHIYALFTRGFTNALSQLRDYQVQLRQSTDGGVLWTTVTLPNGWANIPWHALSMAVDPVNEHKIVVGALDTYVLNNANAPAITPLDWIRLSDWAAMYYLQDPNLTPEERAEIQARYVHADMHDIQYLNNDSDEVLITSDGGVFYTDNMSLTNSINPENPAQPFPAFQHINNGLNTTQYYYARLHPAAGKYEIVGGTQDNGCIYINNQQGTENMISGGDGGYCFWDRDDPALKITTVYGNGFYVHLGQNTYGYGPVNGLFVNPMDYDDQSNLLYSNMATSSFGGLYPQLKDRFYDTLEVLNLNRYLGKPNLGRDTVSFIPLKAGLRDAITAIKVSKYGEPLNRTIVLGTEKGEVYKVTGLPNNASTERIDNDQLPTGYISSVDIGKSENRIAVTFSNFGLTSVWVTHNGGNTWQNIERNLPDMPVRWVLFNPFDDSKLIIATEAGVWGLENTFSEEEQWQSYNLQFPATRVDMIDIRSEDSTILAAAHGHGIWIGKLNQGPVTITSAPEAPLRTISFYPNPAAESITIDAAVPVKEVTIISETGVRIRRPVHDQRVNLSNFSSGVYLLEVIGNDGRILGKGRVVVKR